MHMAVLMSPQEIVAELLKLPGIPLDFKDKNGMTPLHLAARTGRAAVATLLLEHGASFEITDKFGKTPLEYAANSDVYSVIRTYRDKAAEAASTELLKYVRAGDKPHIKTLITDPAFSARADPNITDPATGRTLLHYAVMYDMVDLAQWAIKHGARSTVSDHEGKTPLDLDPSHSMKFLLNQVPTSDCHAGEDFDHPPSFRGELLKWTNYANGWKSRWFELERGVLSYYKHRDDADSACRGAINLRIADIYYNRKYPKQFDVKGKGLKKFRIKAKDEKTAREWIHQLNASKKWAEDYPENSINDAPEFASANGVPSTRVPTGLSRASFENTADEGVTPPDATYAPYGANLAVPAPFVADEGALRPKSPTPSGLSGFSVDSNNPSLEPLQIASNILKNQLCLQSFLVKSIVGELKRAAAVTADSKLSEVIKEYNETANRTTAEISRQLDELERLISLNQKEWLARLRSEQERIDFMADILQTQEIESQTKMDTLARRRKRHIQSAAAVSKRDSNLAAGPSIQGEVAVSPSDAEAVAATKSEAEGRSVATEPGQEEDLDQLYSESEEDESDEFADANDEFFDTVSTIVGNPSVVSTALPSRGSSARLGGGLESPHDESQDASPAAGGVEPGSLTTKDPILLSGYQYPPKLRLAFPDSGNKKPNLNLWQMIKSAIGKDLTKISVPVFFNEPTSFLQRFTEDMEYSTLLDIAAHLSNSTDRTLYVAAFAMSNYSSTFGRVAKPFNPLLGETYEYVRTDKRYRALSEQVSHHPPVSACWVEADNYIYHADTNVKSRFGGKSLSVVPTGVCHVYLRVPLKFLEDPDDQALARPKQEAEANREGNYFIEHYTWNKITTYVQGIITGKFWIEHVGEIKVVNHRTGDVTRLEFKPSTWLGNDRYKVEGQAFNRVGESVYNIAGRWTEKLIAIPLMHGNEPSASAASFDDHSKSAVPPSFAHAATFQEPHGEQTQENVEEQRAKLLVESGLQLPQEPFVLWRVHEPSEVPIPYNITKFAATLNDLSCDLARYLCPTDSRFRPDQRAMEKGEFSEADSQKTYLEEKQRAVRRRREVGELPPWKPRWFVRDFDKDTDEEYWKFTGEYWDERQRVAELINKDKLNKEVAASAWKDVPDIF
ncbi:hypothetical protein EV182_000349 [Spiromyces aspiralis]|uniref:Uncharacterized protein n=1 Tax=Spiromyces aspiralis TaxID=68401 RepID=A0ACC1HJF7_9FUNG|nr:hypothetical protein EV182_000349 [Spiromyces aspiralis]